MAQLINHGSLKYQVDLTDPDNNKLESVCFVLFNNRIKTKIIFEHLIWFKFFLDKTTTQFRVSLSNFTCNWP
jgi:hypothetical protein